MSIKDHIWKKDEKKIEKKIAKRSSEVSVIVKRTYLFLPESVSAERRHALASVLRREHNALLLLEQGEYGKAIDLLESQVQDGAEYGIGLVKAIHILKECIDQVSLSSR